MLAILVSGLLILIIPMMIPMVSPISKVLSSDAPDSERILFDDMVKSRTVGFVNTF